jgi:uracil-DNA glycosylase family 4
MITNAVRCVPPENKPLPVEIKTCNSFLKDRIARLRRVSTIVVLGRIAHDATLAALGQKKAHYPFRHGARHEIGAVSLFDSYHCSRYNTNTGVLTSEMFEAVFADVRALIG